MAQFRLSTHSADGRAQCHRGAYASLGVLWSLRLGNIATLSFGNPTSEAHLFPTVSFPTSLLEDDACTTPTPSAATSSALSAGSLSFRLPIPLSLCSCATIVLSPVAEATFACAFDSAMRASRLLQIAVLRTAYATVVACAPSATVMALDAPSGAQ